jgi:hypothetical protein
MVSKRDGRREEFSRDKMISGLRKACAKRPVTAKEIEVLVDEVEAEFQQNGSGEVSSDVVGTAIMDRLQNLDRVAYIRFASVHRNFEEIESFEKVVKDLREGNQLTLLDMPPPVKRPGRGRRRGGSGATPQNRNGSDRAAETASEEESEHSDESNLSEAVGTVGGNEE